ncbi:NUMOD4 domain-containing protein [Corynebacterium sp. H128]|uniref:NUMOD4 domain-containing protein n=1 Tax=Corynebacterium sp. H128 TaxID=3133427 RepID=UPI00309DADF6
MREYWEPIPGYPEYEVSNRGNVCHLHRKNLLRPKISKHGHQQVRLYRPDGIGSRFRVDWLVLNAHTLFDGRQHTFFHRDGDPTNCRLSNLDYTDLEQDA